MFKRIHLASAVLCFISIAPQANSLEIILNDVADGGSPIEALKGFEAAASLWESYFIDDVTVRLDIGFEQLDPGVLGSTGSSALGFFYSDVRDFMINDISSDADVIATNSLVESDNFDFLVQDVLDPGQFFIVDQPLNDFWNQTLAVNTANAKALGLIADDGVSSDGDIRFSSDFKFDFNPHDGIDKDAFDFIGVAAHEIGHALGFVSGVDIMDIVSAPAGPLAGLFSTATISQFAVFSTLDLFRYSDISANIIPRLFDLDNPLRDFTLGNSGDIFSPFDVGNAADVFFSLDGGVTDLATFSTGRFNGVGPGGGQQASHWEDDLGIGLMDPTAGRGERLGISKLDLLAFDAIGWDVVKVPEPGTLGLFAIGIGLMGLGRRQRKSLSSQSAEAAHT